MTGSWVYFQSPSFSPVSADTFWYPGTSLVTPPISNNPLLWLHQSSRRIERGWGETSNGLALPFITIALPDRQDVPLTHWLLQFPTASCFCCYCLLPQDCQGTGAWQNQETGDKKDGSILPSLRALGLPFSTPWARTRSVSWISICVPILTSGFWTALNSSCGISREKNCKPTSSSVVFHSSILPYSTCWYLLFKELN